MEESQARYQAYLLRLWCEPRDTVWRASLKTAAGDQEIAFANLDELFVYLLQQTEAMEKQRRKFPIAQGETMMTTDVVQFVPKDDALHLIIPHDAIPQMTFAGNQDPNNDDVENNGKLITAALNNAGLAPDSVGESIGLAMAAALFRLRGDIYNTDTGNGVDWPIAWNVFGGVFEIASKASLQPGDFPAMTADLMGDMADSLQAWHVAMPSTAL